MTDEEVVSAAREFLQGLLEVLGESAEVELLDASEHEVSLNLQGAETFPGENQEALRALSYLAEIAVRRRLDRSARIRLDANRYRERRSAELRDFARRWSEQVVRTGEPVELEPMATFERKTIHKALNGVDGVRTHSVGKGAERHIVIEPVE